MIIIRHSLYVQTEQDEQHCEVRVFMPEPDGNCWQCRYEVDWPEGTDLRCGWGMDALQSLLLTLKKIGAELYTSSYHLEGRLRAFPSEKGYGFPVPASFRDILVGADADCI